MLSQALLVLALLAPSPAPGSVATPPRVVRAQLPPGRTVVEARMADLDGDGTVEWVLLARYEHPTRVDRGPGSPEWRAGMRVETRTTHQLFIVGKVGDRWAVRFVAELPGNERQDLLIERLASAISGKGRFPAVITGARACLTSCGPPEFHLVVWDPRTHAFTDSPAPGAEYAAVSRTRGTVDLWFPDRKTGEAMCCPSSYTVARKGMLGFEIATLKQESVPADQMRQVLPPGGLLVHSE